VIPDAAVEARTAYGNHWLVSSDVGGWACSGCDWTHTKIEDFWKAHETRRNDDNIPF